MRIVGTNLCTLTIHVFVTLVTCPFLSTILVNCFDTSDLISSQASEVTADGFCYFTQGGKG